jgi:hypothetical protein
METKHTTGKCQFCGADEALHRIDTLQCPSNGQLAGKNGVDYWLDFTFEDSGIYKLEKAAPEMLEMLIELKSELYATGSTNTKQKQLYKEISEIIKKATE